MKKQQAKLKKHIYSSGAQGNDTSGPSQPDKRNKGELPCEFCERVFKQQDRLKQHMFKHHAKEMHEREQAVRQDQNSPLTTTNDTNAEEHRKAAFESANRPAKVNTSKVVSHKAPRTILQEWLQKNRQAKPQFHPTEQHDGSFTCKVVLPHKYKPDSGRELWMSHPASSKEQAVQHGAVVALATFATELPLERLLGPEYKDIFTQTVAEIEKEKEREKKRKENQRKSRDPHASNGNLQAIHMSEDKRRLVENVVQSIDLNRSRNCLASPKQLSDEQSALVASLRSLGFYENDIMHCIQCCGTESLMRALDWLCVHVDEKRLPRRYAPTTKDNSIEILNTGNTSSKTLIAESENQDFETEQPVIQLTKLGFKKKESREALDSASGDEFAAWKNLYSKILFETLGEKYTDWPYGNKEPNTEVWEDEKYSLQAIIGEGKVQFPSPNSVKVTQDLPFESVRDESENHPSFPKLQVELHVHILDGSGYPNVPPLLGVKCSAMTRPQLRSLTSWLTEQAAEHAEQELPSITELANMLPEMASMVSRSLDGSVCDDDEMYENESNNHSADPSILFQFGSEHQQDGIARSSNKVWEKWRRSNGSIQKSRDSHTMWSRQLSPEFIEAENERLKQELQNYLAAQTGKIAEMRQKRAGLPAHTSVAEVMQAVQNSRVVVLSGETGCGKSTQVPQQILDASILGNSGARTKIVCTQPRRISAIGLADRVADERCESVGETVGYSVRLDSKRSHRTRLLFCTTGILLRHLIEDPYLSTLSHVIVDEVHERSVEGDLLLLLLRRALTKRSDLRVVVMSATADSELFVQYFRDIPAQNGFPYLTGRVHIPGLTHEVHDYFLEDVIELTGFSVGKNSKWARRKQPETKPELGRNHAASSKSLHSTDVETDEEHEEDDAKGYSEGLPNGRNSQLLAKAGNLHTATHSRPNHEDGWDIHGIEGVSMQEQQQEAELDSWEDGLEEWEDVLQSSPKNDKNLVKHCDSIPESWDADKHLNASSMTGLNEETKPLSQRMQDDNLNGETNVSSKQDVIETVAASSIYRVLDLPLDEAEERGDMGNSGSDWQTLNTATSSGYVQQQQMLQSDQREDALDAIARVSRGEYSERTKKAIFNIDEEMLNYDLIEAALEVICTTERAAGEKKLIGSEGRNADDCAKQPGAILVFMPGIAEIMKALHKLEQSLKLKESQVGQLWILPLHGSLAAKEQKAVFERPSDGIRKVVLATNVAETALTVDDVRYVLDTGRLKEMKFDGHKGLSILEDAWVSKASASQRRGRAGRTAPGACLKLFSRHKHSQLEKQQTPEMQRTPLESLCLRVKAILGGNAYDSLVEAISPPEKGAVDRAVTTLKSLGALTEEEQLTPLGQHLVRMPVDPKVGKMLIYAALLQCVDPVLTVASCIGGRGIFIAPQGKKEQADSCKRTIGQSEGKSDHLAAVAAFNGWLRARERGKEAERSYCENNFLSQTALEGVLSQRADFAATLAELGFLTREYWRGIKRGIPPPCESGTPDANSPSKRIVKAALCAGFYPSVAKIEHPRTKYVTTAGGAKEKENEGHQVRFYTRDVGRVFIHPSSVNFGVGKFESPWVVYTERVKTSKVYLRESTMVPSYALLLFGGKITVHHDRGTLKVDEWAEFEASPRTAVLVRELRRAVDSLLLDKIEDPSLDVQSSGAVNALLKLLATDGV